jgi:molybdate transport system ATP-binding protein
LSSRAVSFFEAAPESCLHIDVQKRYAAGAHSFQLQVAFTAPPGVTILVGHSGAGKTTLLRAIAGICDPDKGRIVIAGRVLFDSESNVKVEPAKRKVAFVFQDLALFPHLTVEENVAYGLRKLARAAKENRVTEILNSFQIAKLSRRKPQEISGGEQQRVALARALVTEPSVLLLDEPLSSLDARTKAGIIDDLRAWNEAHGIPILYVTHNHEEVLALGEHAISLEGGEVSAQGTPASVVKPYRQSMAEVISFENVFDAAVVDVREKSGTMVCRVGGTSVEIQLPIAHVTPGSPMHVGIKADEILLTRGRPTMLSACNLIPGRVKQMESFGTIVEARIDAGAEFRVHLPADSPECMNLRYGDSTWMVIRPQSCHPIRPKRLRATQRLFVFICTSNTARSPMAAAICNAEIARRLRVAPEALASLGVQAASAGLRARLGDAMVIEAQKALDYLKVPIPLHRAQNLSPELAAKAEFIFCMSESHRLGVLEMFPQFASKTFRLNSTTEFEATHLEGAEGFLRFAHQVQEVMNPLVDRILTPIATSEPA